MIRTYFKIAIRNLVNQLTYSIINIGGLAIGIACSLVILLYVLQEVSYEKHFKDHQRIYRIATKFMSMGEFANGPEILLEVLPEEYPWIVQSTRIDVSRWEVGYDDFNTEKTGFTVDSSFFNMFPYEFESGNVSKALVNASSVVISKDFARELFGDKEAVGEIIELGEDPIPFTVTGVIDTKNFKSHLNLDFWARPPLQSTAERTSGFNNNWFSISKYNYIKVEPNINTEEVQRALDKLIEKHVFPLYKSDMAFEEWYQRDDAYRFMAQPLDDIYLKGTLRFDTSAGGNATTVKVLFAISLLIMVIASVNFINLTTARATNRAREVGIKKVVGSNRQTLAWQFIGESVMISIIAAIIAFGLAEIVLLVFEKLTGQVLLESIFVNNVNLLLALALAVIIGIISGIYPAFYLSSYKPSQVLKGNAQSIRGNKGFRNILVVFQFVLSIILIICSLIMFQQLQFMKTKDLGFNQENILVVDNAYNLKENFSQFRNRIAERSEITQFCAVQRLPGSSSTYSVTSYNSKNQPENINMNHFGGDYEFLETIGFDLIEGRSFSKDLASDSNAVILNQSAVKALLLDDPVGSILSDKYEVIGVVRDFNFESLRKKIEPAVITLSDSYNNIAIKVNAAQVAKVISFLESEWNAHLPDEPFQYHFLDENFTRLMQNDIKMGQVVTLFTVLAIFISCLGLFGLSAYVTNQRKKEIGIRKVLGASVNNILIMLNREFTKLVLIAVIFAVPVSIYVMKLWLSNFAYKINIGAAIIILSGFIALLIALFTVSYQSLSAATSDPVNSLKEE